MIKQNAQKDVSAGKKKGAAAAVAAAEEEEDDDEVILEIHHIIFTRDKLLNMIHVIRYMHFRKYLISNSDLS